MTKLPLRSVEQANPPALEDLMLHRPPMLLLDEIVSHDAESLTALVRVDRDSSFFDPEACGVPSWVGLEYMAQAIAALNGLSQRSRGEAIKLGMLISGRRLNFACADYPRGSILNVTVEQIVNDGEGMAAYRCRISAEGSGEVLAEGQLGVYGVDT